jgi:hypothetical protein
MAEFCLDCWNRINETNDPPGKYIISKDLDLCEGCGEYKPVIVIEKKYYYLNWLRKIFFPLRVIFFPVEIVVRLILGIIRLIRTKNKR